MSSSGSGKTTTVVSTIKALKYPKTFCKAEVLIINKIDAIEHFDFKMELLKERVRKLNKDIIIFQISAKIGEGLAE